MKRRLLVIATGPADESVLREEVRRRAGGDDAEIRIVAPAAELSPLEWLASDEDEARAEAAQIARGASKAVSETGEVEDAEVGDPDPLQAIEDALRTFPADELIIVTHGRHEATWLEKDSPEEAFERFDLPVTHLVLSEAGDNPEENDQGGT
jgi:hypothetical protein